MIQVYTGNGKGKTTAALGLALRAAGAGFKVYIAQFIKGKRYSELDAIKKISNITLVQCGRACFIKNKPRPRDFVLAQAGLEKVKKALARKCYRIIILDEVNIALKLGLLMIEDVIGIIKSAPSATELILTGRYAPPEICKIADLISDIREVKHHYQKGARARRGIEF